MRFNVCYCADPLMALQAAPVRCDQACLLGSIDRDICVTANKRLLLIFLTALHFRPCSEGWDLNYLRCLFSANSAHRPLQALLPFRESRACSGACQEDKAGSSHLSPNTTCDMVCVSRAEVLLQVWHTVFWIATKNWVDLVLTASQPVCLNSSH